MLSFESFFERLKTATNISSQLDLAKALGIHRSAITQAKIRQSVPKTWILPLCRKYALNPDWLQLGVGHPKTSLHLLDHPSAGLVQADATLHINSGGYVNLQEQAIRRVPHRLSLPVALGEKNTKYFQETHYGNASLLLNPHELKHMCLVPKISDKLCINKGKMELEYVSANDYAFHAQWLSRMGTPHSMLFMDVIGDSMEPSLRDGDTVLIDQARKLSGKGVWAVSLGEVIIIRRVEYKKNERVILKCDNADYEDHYLSKDEQKCLKNIGKVLWMSRDCRWL